MGLHRRSAQAFPEILLGSPAPSDGALFPQRPKLVCFKEVIFRSCCLACGKTSLIGEQTVTGFLFFQSVFCIFLPYSFPFSVSPSFSSLPPSCLLFPSFTFCITARVVQGSNTRKFAGVMEGPSLCFQSVVF